MILKNALGAGIPRGHAILTVHRDDSISGAVNETFEIALGSLDLSIELGVLYGEADVIEEHAQQFELKLGDWSLVGQSNNWQTFPGTNNYNGYYINVQTMVDGGVRHPSEFINANP